MNEEYPAIDFQAEHVNDRPVMEAAALLMADLTAKDARHQRENPNEHEPKTITEGFSLTFETKEGVAGLWSSWLRDSLFLGYPTEWGELPVFLVEEVFPGIVHAPRFRESYGRNVGQWRTAENNLAFEQDQHDSYLHHFHYVHERELTEYGLPEVAYGWGVSEGLTGGGETGRRFRTEMFPDQVRDVGFLTDSFIELACRWANQHDPLAITAELGFVVVPEELSAMGFEIEYLRGQSGVREGWAQDVVYGRSFTEEVMLVSANSLVPWVCYRRAPFFSRFDLESVRNLLTF